MSPMNTLLHVTIGLSIALAKSPAPICWKIESNIYGLILLDGPKYQFIGFHTQGVPTDEKNGTMIWKDGMTYYGQFKADLFQGYGVLTYPNSSKLIQYVGTFENGDFSGHGELTFKNMEKYTGQFSNGFYNGKGVLFCAPTDDCKRYEGEFYNGEFHGYGTLLLENGFFYSGQFLNDKFNGYGKITFGNGSVIDMY